MPKRGKHYQEVRDKVDRERRYSLNEGAELVCGTARTKFDETVDLAVRLGVDPRRADQMVRGMVALPHGTGRKVKVLVFTRGEKEKEALDAGADYVGGDDLIEKIKGGWLEFDRAVATPDMMSVVGKIGKILGPRGLMPNPKSGTVTFDLKKTIKELKAGRVEFKNDSAGIIHCPAGKISFAKEKLIENINTLIDSIVKAKPSGAKGQYLRTITLTSTMGPGLAILYGGEA